jgi:hypothetical protein
MQPSTPPKVLSVEAAAAQPTDADRTTIAFLSARDNKPLPQVTYLVKLRFESMPPATSQGWALYVNDFRIPKYWQYKEGIFFKVFDVQFFRDHQKQSLRFSQNGADFIDTGLKLPPLPSGQLRPLKTSAKLPPQDDLLKATTRPLKRIRSKKTRPKTKRRVSRKR